MTLFRPGDPRPIHFMGIAGAGMSALALIARHLGVTITGCDTDPSGAADLAALGVQVWRGHDPGHLEGARAVVVTAAVPPDHAELERARALSIPIVRRADALGELVADGGGTVVAVAGTHGKTTTTVMVTEALTAAGRTPTGLAGGRVAAWQGNAKVGSHDLFVVEADEYDRSFLSLTPTVAVVNNVEADHLECYGSVAALEQAFAQFAGRARRVIVGGDDAGALRVAAAIGGAVPVWRVGLGGDADVRIEDAELAAGESKARVHLPGGGAVRAARRRGWRDAGGRLRAPPDRGRGDARRCAAGVSTPARGCGVPAAPVLAHGAARRGAGTSARGGRRGGGRADLRRAGASDAWSDGGLGGAWRGPRGSGDDRGARPRGRAGAGRAPGALGRRGLHARRGGHHARGAGAA